MIPLGKLFLRPISRNLFKAGGRRQEAGGKRRE